MKSNITLKTRPFQAFFSAADDLLELARPYHEQVEQHIMQWTQSGQVLLMSQDIWRKEKSLSIGSFVMKYAGLEALVNCTYDDFGKTDLRSIPQNFFGGELFQKRRTVISKPFVNISLSLRTFLLIPTCSNPIVDPRGVFDVESELWKQFKEVVQIRHSFSHAVSVDRKLEVTRVGPKLLSADDTDPSNFWPVTKAPRDHRILNYESAEALNSVIDSVIEKLKMALPTIMTDEYMTQEQAKVS